MVTTSGGIPGKLPTEFSTGLPVGNKKPKGGGKSPRKPAQPKKVSPKKK